VSLTVEWPRPGDETAEALGNAAKQRSYAAHDPNAALLFRLAGSVRGRTVSLRATPYIERGVRSRGLELSVKGEITDTDAGSRLDAKATANIPLWMAILVSGFLVVVTIEGGLGALIVSAIVFGVVAVLAIPRYQRTELKKVDQLAAALARL
jgi:hypothetical protein